MVLGGIYYTVHSTLVGITTVLSILSGRNLWRDSLFLGYSLHFGDLAFLNLGVLLGRTRNFRELVFLLVRRVPFSWWSFSWSSSRFYLECFLVGGFTFPRSGFANGSTGITEGFAALQLYSWLSLTNSKGSLPHNGLLLGNGYSLLCLLGNQRIVPGLTLVYLVSTFRLERD